MAVEGTVGAALPSVHTNTCRPPIMEAITDQNDQGR